MKIKHKKLRIAIAGLGFGKKVHLEALKESGYLIPKQFFIIKKSKNQFWRKRLAWIFIMIGQP